MSPTRSCVIIVENLPVPFDRRVWQEAKALRSAGWQVAVICPRNSRYNEEFEEIDGIAIYRHNLPLEARGRFAFLIEYAWAIFHQLRLLFKIWRERDFHIIQACNPPDLSFLVVLPFKLLGKKFVFDHHDLCPELFSAKFGRKGWMYHALRLTERLTFKCADLVIATNETFRKIAIERGRKAPDKVVAVYSVPDTGRIRRVEPDAGLRRGRGIVLGYLGVINAQDGVDHLIRAVEHLVKRRSADVQVVVVGDGPALKSVRALSAELGIGDHVTFTGYLSGETMLRTISAFDIGVIPDPVNDYNDKIAMNKVFEYSALGIPAVAYALSETKRLMGDACVYAPGDMPIDLAEACMALISDDELRERTGAASARLGRSFSWENEAVKYVNAFDALSRSASRIASLAATAPESEPGKKVAPSS